MPKYSGQQPRDRIDEDHRRQLAVAINRLEGCTAAQQLCYAAGLCHLVDAVEAEDEMEHRRRMQVEAVRLLEAAYVREAISA